MFIYGNLKHVIFVKKNRNNSNLSIQCTLFISMFSISISPFMSMDCSVPSHYIRFVSSHLDILLISISPYLDGPLNHNCLEIALPMSICSLFHGLRRQIFCEISALTLVCCCLLVVAKIRFHSGKLIFDRVFIFHRSMSRSLPISMVPWHIEIGRVHCSNGSMQEQNFDPTAVGWVVLKKQAGW